MMLVDTSDSAAVHAETLVQAEQLRQLLRWLAVACFACVPLNLVVAVLTQSPVFPVIAIIAAGLGTVSLLAQALVRRGLVRPAAFLVASGLLTVAVCATYVLPTTMVAMAAMPLMVAVMLLTFLSRRTMAALIVICPLSSLGIYLLGAQLPQDTGLASILIGALTAGLVSLLTLLLCWQLSRRLNITLREVRSANTALEQTRDDLEDQVMLRTADLQAALDSVRAQADVQAGLLAENEHQRALIREMSVPILPVSSTAIVIPLVGELDSARLQTMQELVLRAIEQRAARHALLDITGVSLIDSQVAQGLISVVQSARLLGAEVVLVGVRPEVAQMVVSLGLHMGGVVTRHSLQQGILYTLGRERLGAQSA